MNIWEWTAWYLFVGIMSDMFFVPAINRYLPPEKQPAARFPILFACTFFWPLVLGHVAYGFIKIRRSPKKGQRNDT